MIKYNLNDHVHIKLDEKGKEILKKYYSTCNENLYKSNQYQGYYKFQFWQFVDIFGGTSSGMYAPYSTECYIESSDTKKIEEVKKLIEIELNNKLYKEDIKLGLKLAMKHIKDIMEEIC